MKPVVRAAVQLSVSAQTPKTSHQSLQEPPPPQPYWKHTGKETPENTVQPSQASMAPSIHTR